MVPFYDRRRERRIARRPVAVVAALLVVASMGVLTYKGATAKESLGSENVGLVPQWVQQQNLSADGEKGATIFALAGCMGCHTYLGAGTPNLGAPDLSAEGAKGRGEEFQIDHLKCPSCVNPGLADAALHELHGRAVPPTRHLPRRVEGPPGRRGLELPERER